MEKKKDMMKKYALVVFAILVYAFNLKAFVYNANLISSGITGLSIFVQRLLLDFAHIAVPLTVVSMILNIIPATIAWIVVGKKFTIVSFLIVNAMTFVTDLMPSISPITTDLTVAAVFAGILNGFSLGYILKLGFSSGGTDFISIAVAKKYHIPIFNYVMIFNIILICVQGIVYGFEQALYSIIFQFVTTQVINYLYRHFEKRTLFIITNKPDEISRAVIEHSEHSVTKIQGVGGYSGREKNVLYLIVTEPELKFILQLIKDTDRDAFINVVKSNEVSGNFHYLPVAE